MSGSYAAADALGRFNAQPLQAQEVSPGPHFDFDELEPDPSERRPGGHVARRLWAAEPQVRQWKWVSVGALFMLAMLLQSIAMYLATRRYVRWVNALREEDSESPRMQLTLRLLQPRDTFAEALGTSEASMDLVMLAIPLGWLVAVVQARNLRLWTRSLLSASLLALCTGVLSCLTMLPQPMGWEACEAQLRDDVLLHYRGGEGMLPDAGKAFGLILWIWLQDLVLGMRLQGQLVCAGSSISGPTWYTAIFALALYDLWRMWARKLKPHFREVSHVASGCFLAALVLVDAGLSISSERQYTAAVCMALVLAMLIYQSPALAVCTDRLLLRSTPPLELKGEATPMREENAEEAGRDWGDVVVPPCCLPFCAFHGRYFLYPQPASEYEQELLANLQAQAELEELQKEHEQSARRLLELEGQLEALHARQARRVEEEPKEFERQLQERLSQQREAFQKEMVKLQAEAESAQQERLQLEEVAQAEARKEELLAMRSKAHLLILPAYAWAAIYDRFQDGRNKEVAEPLPRIQVWKPEDISKAVEAPCASQASPDLRQMPQKAWQKLYLHFPQGFLGACAVKPVAPVAPLAKLELIKGDLRCLPAHAWQRLYQRFRSEPAAATAVEVKLYPTMARAAHLRPSATPYISRR